jgi:hypothetical protein
MKLYHYTCSHTRPKVGTRGMLRPNPHPWLGKSLLWLTDQETPDRDGLGLTSRTLACDRLEFRYIVDTNDAKPWNEFATSIAQRGRMILEGVPGAKPQTWWVCETSQLGILDREYRKAVS